MRDVFAKCAKGEKLDDEECSVLLNGFNFVRVINGLAEQLGVNKKNSDNTQGCVF